MGEVKEKKKENGTREHPSHGRASILRVLEFEEKKGRGGLGGEEILTQTLETPC